jgi:hypothetical protein
VTNHPTYGGVARLDTEHRKTHVLTATEFDELAVGRWLHIEQMDSGHWWLNVGGVTMHIEVDPDGRPRNVEITGPDVSVDTAPECAYRIAWNPPGDQPANDHQAKP